MGKDYSKLSKEDLLKIIARLESSKRYGLVWDQEHTRERFEAEAEDAIPVLSEVREKKIVTNGDGPANILIEGDNYHSLSVLNYTHREKIDAIFIDPPYNTGKKDFRYNDTYVDLEDTYRHSKWLSFMSKRLLLSKSLLKEDGVIFISIGDDEVSQLRLLCDDIFSEKNYITTFIWEKTQHFGRQKINFYSNADYILCYAKRLNAPQSASDRGTSVQLKELLVQRIQDEFEDAPLYNASNRVNTTVFPAGSVRMDIPDGKYSGTTDPKYELLDTVRVKKHTNAGELRLKFRSRWSQDTVNQQLITGTRFWVKTENFAIRAVYGTGKVFNDSPKQIIFTNENNEFCARSRFCSKVGVNEEATSELKAMLGDQTIFNYPKPRTLIEYLLSLLYDPFDGAYRKDLTILDFFAGSGTTGHAVLSMNAMDGGTRSFILCTDNEEGICSDVCYPRIKTAIEGYGGIGGLGGNLRYFQTSFVKKSLCQDDLKTRLAAKCTELLCLREGIFDERATGNGYRIFEQAGRVLAVYYAMDPGGLGALKRRLDKMHGKKVLYCFTLDPLGLDEHNFDNWTGVRLEPIPQQILDIYEDIHEH